MFRRLLLAASACAFAAGCAHVEGPPGGPEDRIPPGVLSIVPAPDTVAPQWTGPIVVSFDERISEQGVEESVILSPRTSPVAVSHGRSEIRVSLREGWVPGVIYQLTILPEIRDLFGNRLEEPVTLVFSTGPEIPATLVSGRVTDRLTAEPEVGVRVEAIRQVDSLVYAARTDSVGSFEFARIPAGDYLLRSFEDLNRNRALDGYERRDSALLSIAADLPVDEVQLRLLAADSTAPVPGAATVEGRTFEIEFDDHLDPEQEIDPGQIVITGPGGETVPVGRVAVGSLPPLPADTATADPTGPVPPADPAGPVPPAPGPGAAAVELPSRVLVIEPAEGVELQPGGEYRIEVSDIENVAGLAGSGSVTVTVPLAEPAPDPDAAPAAAPPAAG